MKPLLYAELVPWYRLVDPLPDHCAEASAYAEALSAAHGGTLLELGAGAGNNAFYMKPHFRCTLTDLSPEMQALSKATNPECEHLLGDMRALRLGRTFDAVFVHDAICYATNEDALKETIRTAAMHTRSGGVALFAPDFMRETFAASDEVIRGEDGDRALRCLEWTYDPDPNDTTYTVDFAFLLRDGKSVRAVHDQHVEGLFPRETWLELLASEGFSASLVERPLDESSVDAVFLCRKK